MCAVTTWVQMDTQPNCLCTSQTGHYQLISNQIFERLERAGEPELRAGTAIIELLQRQTQEKYYRQISFCFFTKALKTK